MLSYVEMLDIIASGSASDRADLARVSGLPQSIAEALATDEHEDVIMTATLWCKNISDQHSTLSRAS
jgi:hypothetical protein